MKTYVAPIPGKIYQATTNSDLNEGRGHEIVIAHFFKKEDADRAAMGKGVQGSNGYVLEYIPPPLTVFESYDEYIESKRIILRKQAILKLTTEEQEALGIDPSEQYSWR